MKNILLFFSIALCYHNGISQCVDNGNQWTKSWTSCQIKKNPNPIRPISHWILYEFVENHYIDSTHIWNANRDGESGSGIKDIIVDYSLDGRNWESLGNFTIPQAPEDDNYQGVVGPNFESKSVRKILITVLNTHASTGCATFGEMLFAVDSDKCHGVIDECGICNGLGPALWYIDADGDGKGNDSQVITACEQPFGFVDNDTDICDNGQLGWVEIFPLFENSCKGCHIANTSGGLNLGSYESFIQGGLNCGASLTNGTTLVNVITIDQYDGCQAPISFPAMNSRTSSPLTSSELEMLQRWIDAGFPKSCVDFCPESEAVNSTFGQGTIAYRQTSQEISSNANIGGSTLITFDAGEQIQLGKGFTILTGGQFIAKSDGCE